MVQRRKNSNWFSRQLTRMGSMRSSSTAYSSNGLFKRNRHNSVYSSPESRITLPGNQQLGPPPASQKMSLYDKFVNRKSIRNQRHLLKRGKFLFGPYLCRNAILNKCNRFFLQILRLVWTAPLYHRFRLKIVREFRRQTLAKTDKTKKTIAFS